ncbi:MAG TPA: DUF2909 domain-containing protein [Pseudomonadales bacterium]|nr:DUF2909 domain-containing protein [Pseudomonadales bacterium]
MSTALLKTLIIILFIAVVASLSSALFFLFKDTEESGKRTLYALGTRITLAACLVGLVFYGVESGKLSMGAPWSGQTSAVQVEKR